MEKNIVKDDLKFLAGKTERSVIPVRNQEEQAEYTNLQPT